MLVVMVLVGSCLGLGMLGWLGGQGYVGSVVGLVGLVGAAVLFIKGGSRFRVGAVLGGIFALLTILVGIGVGTQKAEKEAAAVEQREREEQERVAAIAKLPELVRELETAMQQGEWEKAAALHAEGMKVQPDHAGLAGKGEVIAAGVEKLRQEQAEAQRKTTIAEAVGEASKVAADKELCGNTKALGEVWGKLRQVRETDTEYAAAKGVAVKLERCRVKMEADLTESMRGIMVSQREQMAQTLETSYLDNGMDIRVKLRGKYKDQVTLSWPLMSRVTVHQITKSGDFTQNLEKAGFKRITFTDGFSESWNVDLNPIAEEGAGKKVLEELKLGEPIQL